MAGLLFPSAYALAVWFLGTGIVLMLDNLPRRTFRWSMAVGTLLFAISLHRIAATAQETSAAATYAAFLYGVIAWAWHEMSFFMGFVTGPSRIPAPPGAPVGTRFRMGFAASAWHELAILATAGLILAITWRAPNQVGTWTFLLLWLMRTSAKLNVVLGVLNLGEEFIPAHLRYLLSFMARRPLNPLMPVSLALGTIGAAWLWQAAIAASGTPRAGLAMVATMLALAVIEHWFLILPIPFARLWAWSLRFKPKPGEPALSGKPSPRTTHGLSALLP